MIFLSNEYWEVKETWNRGRGLFAKKALNPGVVIGDYIGKVLKTAEVDIEKDKQDLYLMYYHDQASIYPDLRKVGIHLLNHSCTPNCWLYTYKGHTLAFTLRHIFPKEELTISYLLAPKDEFCKPCAHTCKCQSLMCKGTMHQSMEKYEKWRAYQEANTIRYRRQRIRYGKELKPLSSYPKMIPDNSIYDLFGYTKKEAMSFGDKTLPPTTEIRKLIRKAGRVLKFPALDTQIYGVLNDRVIARSAR